MNSIRHCLDFAESVSKVKPRNWGERVIKAKAGKGDYGVVGEPYAVNLNFMPPITYSFPRDNSIRRWED
tara:strand:+ start:755 stop:961 length:207 start_codon:yes stop_codon:yes gene_type:complete